jgi:hypothetical protein
MKVLIVKKKSTKKMNQKKKKKTIWWPHKYIIEIMQQNVEKIAPIHCVLFILQYNDVLFSEDWRILYSNNTGNAAKSS